MSWTAYTEDLASQTFAIITAGGIDPKANQQAFNMASIHGDPSLDTITKSIRREKWDIDHAHYDHGSAGSSWTPWPPSRP